VIAELQQRFPGQVLRFAPSRWRNLYVVGDVHGCAGELSDMLDRIGAAGDELVVCVGDVVRRGPDSPRAVELVESHPNVLSVRGNSEHAILSGDRPRQGLTHAQIEAIGEWPLAVAWNDHLVVHSGLDPTRPVSEHGPEDLFDRTYVHTSWGLLMPWFELHDSGPRVLFGHLPSFEPLRAPRALGVDTGCVYGGRLTAYDVGGDRFMHVSARRAYHPRRPEEYFDADRVLLASVA